MSTTPPPAAASTPPTTAPLTPVGGGTPPQQPTQGNTPPTQGGNTPPTQGGNTPPTQGGNTPPTQGGNTPPTQGGNTPPTQGGNAPPTQGGNTPPTQGGNTPPTQGGNTPPPTPPSDPPATSIPWWLGPLAIAAFALAAFLGWLVFRDDSNSTVTAVEGSSVEAASTTRLDDQANQLADHEDRIATSEDRINDNSGQIAALQRNGAGSGQLVVPACDVSDRFEGLDQSLQNYWRAHGPNPPQSCLAHPAGTDARTACSSYAAWYQFAVSCRSERADEYAARVQERESLN